jgi:hypothetical protein
MKYGHSSYTTRFLVSKTKQEDMKQNLTIHITSLKYIFLYMEKKYVVNFACGCE